MNLILNCPTDKEFEIISTYIQEFELDNRNLKQEQFIVALCDNIVVGFGRLQQHADCTELCSLGVVPMYRKKGIGKKMVAQLIHQITQPIYLVSIIPTFFYPFGFKVTKDYPAVIKNKLTYCTGELCVPEKYTAMCLPTSL